LSVPTVRRKEFSVEPNGNIESGFTRTRNVRESYLATLLGVGLFCLDYPG
jgi:hypothetical protein